MGVRVNEFKVEADIYVEFEGAHTIKFTMPPDHPLVWQILRWHSEQLLAAARAEGAAGGGPTIG